MLIPKFVIDAVDGLSDGALLVDADGLIVAVNSAALTMFGAARDQMVGNSIDGLMPSSASDPQTSSVDDEQSNADVLDTSYECQRRDGERFQANVSRTETEIDGSNLVWLIVRELDDPVGSIASQNQAMTTLDDVGRLATSTIDLAADFEAVAERLNEVAPHERMWVTLVSETDSSVIEVVFRAGSFDQEFNSGELFSLEGSATQVVVETRSSVSYTSENLDSAPMSIKGGLLLGFSEGYITPLFEDDEVIGSLLLATRESGGFAASERSLIDRFANHLAVAISNRRVREKLEVQTNENRMIGQIGRLVSSSDDLEQAFSSAESLIGEFVHFDRFSVFSVDLEERRLSKSLVLGEKFGDSEQQEFTFRSENVEDLRAVFANKTPVEMKREQLVELGKTSEIFEPLSTAGYERIMIVPLAVTNQPVGFIVFGSKEPVDYTEQETEMATRIGTQVAGSTLN